MNTVPTGFSTVPARWTGDASNSQAEVGAGFFSGAFGHGASHRVADGSVQGEESLRHADGSNLGLVGIGDEPFQKYEGCPGHIGDAVGEQSAGAGFSGRQRLSDLA